MAVTAPNLEAESDDVLRSSTSKSPDKELNGPALLCEDAPYPRFTPGDYEARCVAAKVYRDPRFRRWVARLEFRLMGGEGGVVYAFLNLGTGAKALVTRGSEYRRAWVIANDGIAPRKRQVMSLRAFIGKIFLVRIGDTSRRFDGRDHPAGEVYSTVKEVKAKVGP